MVLFIAPLRQCQAGRCFVIGRLLLVALLTFSLFSTTVLAEPTVTQVEEVCSLVHNLVGTTGCQPVVVGFTELGTHKRRDGKHDRLTACRTLIESASRVR